MTHVFIVNFGIGILLLMMIGIVVLSEKKCFSNRNQSNKGKKMIAIDATFYFGTQMTRFHLYQVVPRIGETVELDFGEGYEYYFVRTVKWSKLRGGHACGTVPVEIDVTKA